MFVKIGAHILNDRHIAGISRSTHKQGVLIITMAVPAYMGSWDIEVTGPEADKLERYLAAGAIDLDLERVEEPAPSGVRYTSRSLFGNRLDNLIHCARTVVAKFKEATCLDIESNDDRHRIEQLAAACDTMDRLHGTK